MRGGPASSSQGEGWWLASDGSWYSPDQESDLSKPSPPTGGPERKGPVWKRKWFIITASVVGGLLLIGIINSVVEGDGSGESGQTETVEAPQEPTPATTETADRRADLHRAALNIDPYGYGHSSTH